MIAVIFVAGLIITTFIVTSGDDGPTAPTANIPGSWHLVSSGTSVALSDVDFVDPLNGWAVGDVGTIIHTSDGGETWEPQIGGINVRLNAVGFVSQTEGWVVGNIGVILHTSDGGETWDLQGKDVALGLNLIALSLVDANTVWAITERGSVMLKTENGGETWDRQFFSNSSGRSDFAFIDQDHGWVALSQGSLMSTTDAGSNWDFSTALLTDVSIRTISIFFLDENHGWISGWRGRSSSFQFVRFLTDGMVARTTDGGITWTRQDIGSGRFVWDVAFLDVNEGWAVGSSGSILYSNDGGASWTPQFSDTQMTLRSIVFANENTAWAVGEEGVVVKFSR